MKNKILLVSSTRLLPLGLKGYLFILLSLFFFNILQSLVIDSKISFDVSNFYNLNFYSFIAFIVISLLFVIYYQLINLLLIPVVLQGTSLPKQVTIFVVAAALIYS